MEHRGRVYLLVSLFACALMLLLGSATLTLVRLPALELKAARSRWAQRSFTHYRLDLKYGALGYCRQSMEIQGERVVAVIENSCQEPPPTVDTLFEQIAQELATRQGSCGPNGCECDGTIAVTAEYDPQLGFPRAKALTLDPLGRWSNLAYWQRRMAGAFCSSRALSGELITVVALQPMG